MTRPAIPLWISAADLAGLPGLPDSERRVLDMATREDWPSRQRAGRGGGREFSVAGLPPRAQQVLYGPADIEAGSSRLAVVEAVATFQKVGHGKGAAVREAATAHGVSVATVWRYLGLVTGVPDEERLAALTPAAPAETTPSNPVEARIDALPDSVTQLTDAQRGIMIARLALLDALEVSPVPLVEMAEADDALRALAVRANEHGERLPSASTIKRWKRFRREGGEIALAPVFKPRQSEPAWLAPFWRFYGIPSKPSIAWAREKMMKEHPDMSCPPLRTMQHYIKKMGDIARNKGRMGSRELKKYRPYRARNFLELEPLDVVSADGHRFDAEILHPNTGNPFRPEIASIIDIGTRRLVGWSVDLAENKMMVAAAIRKACETGIPAIFYSDNGPGYKNADLDDEALGMLQRCGITKETALPYGAQAKGVIERFNGTVLVRAAKAMPGYIGADMDDEAKQKVHHRSRAVISGKSDAKQPLAEWDVFMQFMEAEIAEYNARPHSSLPKIRDPETGRRRHQSPDERWAMWVDKGWEPVTASTDVLDDLWRPYVTRIVQRGLVQIGNGHYFSRALDLEDMNGKAVQVGQDIHDVEQVWIRDMDGRFLCAAKLNDHASDYFPKSRVEMATEKRANSSIKRLQAKEDALLANTRAGLVQFVPAEDAMPEVSPRVAERMARIAGTVEVDPTVVQIPADRESRLRLWRTLQARVEAGEILNGVEERFHQSFQKTPAFRAAQRLEGFGQEKGPANGAS